MENNNQTKKQTFLYGAVILIAATLIVKVIGFIFKIPLRNYILYENNGIGMAYFNTAYNIYVLFFTISTAGLPVALSRLTAVENVKGNYKNERRIFNVAMVIFCAVGIVGTALMIIFAKQFAAAASRSDAYLSIIVIAPTLLFVCITAAYRGLFQGRRNMIPTAISEVIEALGKLAVGLAAGFYAISKGYDTVTVAAFAISGLTIGVAIGALYLFLTDTLTRLKSKEKLVNAPGQKTPKRFAIAKEVFRIAIPITLSSSLLSLSSLIDTFIMGGRLQYIGYTEEQANIIYANYSTMAISIFNFPNALVVPFAISIIPVIAAAFYQKKAETVRTTIESTFRMVFIIAMPCSMGVAAMSQPVLNLLFNDKVAVADTAPLLSVLAIAIVFVAMVSVTNSMLQAQKMESKTLLSMACGGTLKLVTSYVLIGIPQIGRFGTPIGTCVCYLTIVLMNFYFLSKHMKVLPALKNTFVKPFIAAALCAFMAILSYKLLSLYIRDGLATLIALAVAVIVYVFMLFIQKTLLKEDVLLLPKGERIYKVLHRINFI